MAWVRSDDQFCVNIKIQAIVMDDLAAIGLFWLARTWTASQPVPGYIPEHTPGMLVADKRKGARLAGVLLRHGVFHPRNEACMSCQKVIAERCWPAHDSGYVFHDWWKYEPPARDRVTPGTPADLSEIRRAAGRTGGQKSAANRAAARAMTEANTPADQAREASGQANGVSKTVCLDVAGASKSSNTPSNGVTPVVGFTPTEQNQLPEPVPPTAGFASQPEAKPHTAGASSEPGSDDQAALVRSVTQRAQPITDAYHAAVGGMCKWPAINGVVIHALKTGRYADEAVQAALLRLAGEGRSVTIETLRIELEGLPPNRQGAAGHPYGARQAETDRLFDDAMDRARQLEARLGEETT